jgi:TetR/AcrR family transcriptional regulator
MAAKLPTKKVGAQKRNTEKVQTVSSRDRILDAALREFANRGLFGARVDVIAKQAAINKQLIYYHFGSKEALYVCALEKCYRDLRAREKRLDLGGLDPIAAMTKFIEFTFDYVIEHREFVLLLMNENLQEARYLKQSEELKLMRGPLASILKSILRDGIETDVFHNDIDPIKLYISIASLCFFYSSNIYTLSVFLEADLRHPKELASNRQHITEVILGYLASRQPTNRKARHPVPAPAEKSVRRRPPHPSDARD